MVYQGGFGYRYPYDVTLSDCRAGTPHTTLFEDDVVNQAGMFAGRRDQMYDGEGLIPAAIPVTAPEQRQQLEEALAGLEDNSAAQLERQKALQSEPWPTTVDWDGRANYEKDKEAMTQPVMQHYLKRMKPWMYK